MGLVAAFSEALVGLKSMVVGLKVTGTNFFRPQETIHYPRREVEADVLATFRGHIELVGLEEDPSAARCVGCGLCMELCPSRCIRVEAEDPPPTEAPPSVAPTMSDLLMPTPKFRAAPPSQTPVVRKLLGYHLTYHTCSLCGLCVQNCPAGSLRFSSNVYFAGESRETFELDLMARLRRQAGRKGGAP